MDLIVCASKFTGFTNRKASTGQTQSPFALILPIILKSLRFYVLIHKRLETVMEKLKKEIVARQFDDEEGERSLKKM